MILCTVGLQAPLSMGFSMPEYGSGLPFPSPGDLPDPGIERRSPALQADTLPSEPPGKLCPTLCDTVDFSLPGTSLHGILQARVLEWVAISFSRDLPDPGIEPGSPTSEADALTSEPPGKPHQFSSVQFISVAQSCPTLCDPMNRRAPGLPVHHHLPEFTQTHVH